MDKIYGFKQKDVELLIKYLKDRQNASLSKEFARFAADTGKSKGTVRNMYYAIAKRAAKIRSLPINTLTASPFPYRRSRNLKKKRSASSSKRSCSAKKTASPRAGSSESLRETIRPPFAIRINTGTF